MRHYFVMLKVSKFKALTPVFVSGMFLLNASAVHAQSATPQVAILAAASVAAANDDSITNPTFLHDVQPLFLGKCARCHNSDSKYLPDWTDYKVAYAHRREIERRVWDSWKGDYYKQAMPAGDCPEMRSTTEADRALIKRWVDDGAPYGIAAKVAGNATKADRIRLGKRLFNTMCATCHQLAGQGVANKYPPLAGSDFMNEDKDRAIMVLLDGKTGPIVVNGKKYDNTMPKFPLSDDAIANALTYAYNSFGNSGKDVTPQEVKALRAKVASSSASQPANGIKPSKWE
jgi:mono/diheme cytochrome c family protein